MKYNNGSKWAAIIIWVAVGLAVLLIPVIGVYFWKESLSIDAPINDGKFGTFGDFVGGFLGSIWSLCGVILFYLALKEQREDFNTNNKALVKQVEALEIQGHEFKLQRNEMELSREVYREQSKTLRRQRLDATYFSLIDLYKKSLADLNSREPNGNYFKSFKEDFLTKETLKNSPKENYYSSKSRYLDIYFLRKEELSHYFKVIYRIIKVIDQAEINDVEKFRYIKILRSQLSENEMLALYYNSHSDFGGELYKLILKYNLLKHLPCISKIEFHQYSQFFSKSKEKDPVELDISRRISSLHRFSYEIAKLLRYFQETLGHEIKEDDFKKAKISLPLPLCEDHIISLQSSEYNELTLQIFRLDGRKIKKISQLTKSEFELFFCEFLYDVYWFSQYIQFGNKEELVLVSGDDFKIKFELKSRKKLLLSCDME